MEPWYKLVTPRKEVREGRSFNPDEFAIALEQVVAGSAPDDYKKPEQFFSRTCFTRRCGTTRASCCVASPEKPRTPLRCRRWSRRWVAARRTC